MTTKEKTNQNQLAVFITEDGKVSVDVRFDVETAWLSLDQMAELFERNKSTISRHIKNVYEEGELVQSTTVAKYATVQTEGARKIERQIEFYNLDVIISVGYRVKSIRGTQFRQWANTVLKQHLIQGYSVNEKRLEQVNRLLQIVARTEDETISGVANVLQRYTVGLDLLDDYDYQRVTKPKTKKKGAWKLTYDEARLLVDSMKYAEASNLFGNEKDESFKSSVGAIYQTFDGEDLYPSVQEKAAVLLYLVVKNHSFSDGNKRIAAALFVYFLDKNRVLITKSGRQIIDNNALAAMTLMIALSKPAEKDVMCALVMNMLEERA